MSPQWVGLTPCSLSPLHRRNKTAPLSQEQTLPRHKAGSPHGLPEHPGEPGGVWGQTPALVWLEDGG